MRSRISSKRAKKSRIARSSPTRWPTRSSARRILRPRPSTTSLVSARDARPFCPSWTTIPTWTGTCSPSPRPRSRDGVLWSWLVAGAPCKSRTYQQTRADPRPLPTMPRMGGLPLPPTFRSRSTPTARTRPPLRCVLPPSRSGWARRSSTRPSVTGVIPTVTRSTSRRSRLRLA